MSNTLDGEIYTDNNDLLGCAPTIRSFDGSGLLQTTALSGRTDGVAFLSLSALTDGTATPIHSSLSQTLVEIGVTGQYEATMYGSDKTSHLSATTDGTTVYRHFQFGTDYHESKGAILRKQRVAA